MFPPPGGRAANGHAGHVRQPVDAEGLGHRLRSEHHDQLHAGKSNNLLTFGLAQVLADII